MGKKKRKSEWYLLKVLIMVGVMCVKVGCGSPTIYNTAGNAVFDTAVSN